MKKILITSTDMMMIQFLVPHVKYLSEHGFHVEIACSEVGNRMEDVRIALGTVAKAIHTVRLERSPANPRNLLGYRDMRMLLKKNQYDIIWTNEPVMGVVTRLAARDAQKSGTRVVYMCHGFHFFKGSGLPSWLIFYPIERFMSRFCDCIVTINHEDETRAKTFFCPRVEHIDGIGVDFSKLQTIQKSGSDKRTELDICDEDILILSVGELQKRKNHQVIIRAISQLKNPHIKYVICGTGVLRGKLENLAASLDMNDQVIFLGYRNDVPEIMTSADIYAHPSVREGLGLASLEAMALGLPLITSNIQGIPDYVENGVTGYMCDPNDVEEFTHNLQILIDDHALRNQISNTNLLRVKRYAMENIQPRILDLLNSLL